MNTRVKTGDVVLKDLELKAEALNELKLPVTVKSGFLGSVRLKVSNSERNFSFRHFKIFLAGSLESFRKGACGSITG